MRKCRTGKVSGLFHDFDYLFYAAGFVAFDFFHTVTPAAARALNALRYKSAYWFMADSAKVDNSLMALFAERPELDAPEQVYENKNWTYSLDFFYTTGLGLPA